METLSRRGVFVTIMLIVAIIARAYDFEVNGIYYEKTSDKEVAVTKDGAKLYSGSIIIPETIKFSDITYSVTSIKDYAFNNCSELTSVVIPNTVASIGRSAFGLSGIRSITIPESVKTINIEAFTKCKDLVEVHINTDVIGGNMFSDCISLTSVNISNSVKIINQDAFSGCSSLRNIVIPNSVTSIGSSAFSGCNALESIDIPNSITVINDHVFYQCTSLLSILFPESLEKIGNFSFYGCSALKSVNLPSGLKYIDDSAFKYCTGLEKIQIPNSVTNIGYQAFSDCSSLESVTLSESLNVLSNQMFMNCTSLKFINIPSAISKIGNQAFRNCIGLTSIQLSEGLSEIEPSAFSECVNLKSISIPSSVKKIGSSAFYKCTNLASVSIPNSIEEIESSTFLDCSSLESIIIPNSIISIGNSAFRNCSGLSSVSLGNRVRTIGDNAFSGCTNLSSITIPNSVTTIEICAFQNCSSLTDVVLSETLNVIRPYVFKDCIKLNAIAIPDSVTVIGAEAFYGCEKLESIIFSNSLKNIYRSAFINCRSLTDLHFPDSVVSIDAYAFYGCRNLTSIILPNSLATLGDYAFSECDSLSEIKSYIIDPFVIDNTTFSTYGKTKLYVNSACVPLYKATGGWKNFQSILPLDGTVTQSVELKVFDDSGKDITDNVNVIWTDSEGKQVGEGNIYSGYNSETSLFYSIILDENLGIKYHEIRKKQVVGIDEDNTISITLVPFKSTMTNVSVLLDNEDFGEITVSSRQYLNDKYIVNDTLTVINSDSFSIGLLDAPGLIRIECPNYLSHISTFDNPSEVSPLQITLEPTGTKSIIIDADYIQSTVDGPVSNKLDPVVNNILYSVTESRTGDEIIKGVLKSTNLQLPRKINEGQRMELTLTSAENAFDKTSVIVKVGVSDTIPVALKLYQTGSIQSSYGAAGIFKAILYDKSGNVVNTDYYNGGHADFVNVPEGEYTVISIADGLVTGVLATLDDYSLFGLESNKHYSLNKVSVRKGYVAAVYPEMIPEPGSMPASAITANTTFYSSRANVTTSEYVTANLRLNLSNDILERNNGGSVIFSLPSGCHFVLGSMFVNTTVVPTSSDGSKIRVNLSADQLDAPIKFNLRADKAGDYFINALLSLDMKGDVSVKAGEMYFHVSAYDLYTPKGTNVKSFFALGTATPDSRLEIYEGETLLGTAMTNKAGKWKTTLELHNPLNSSKHTIWAQGIDADGFRYICNPRDIVYDKNWISPQQVTMLYYGQKNVFNLDGTANQSSYYIYFTDPSFTFLIDFNDNNPDVISGVELKVFTEKNNCVVLPAEYDAVRKQWVTSHVFSGNDLPVNVDVDYVADIPYEPDFSDMSDLYSEVLNKDENLVEVSKLLSNAEQMLDDPNCPVDSIDYILYQIDRKLDIYDPPIFDYGDNDPNMDWIEKMNNAKTIEELERITDEAVNHLKSDWPEDTRYKDLLDTDVPDVAFNGEHSGIKISRILPSGGSGQSNPTHMVDPLRVKDGYITMYDPETGERVSLDISGVMPRFASDENPENAIVNATDFIASRIDEMSTFIETQMIFLNQNCYRHFGVARIYDSCYRNSNEILTNNKNLTKDEYEEILKCKNKMRFSRNMETYKMNQYNRALLKMERLGNVAKVASKGTAIVSTGLVVNDVVSYQKSWDPLLTDINALCNESTRAELLALATAARKEDMEANRKLNTARALTSGAFMFIGAASAPTVAGTLICFAAAVSADAGINYLIEQQKSKAAGERAKFRYMMMQAPGCTFPGGSGGNGSSGNSGNGSTGGGNGSSNNTGSSPIQPIRDPSGYVYEGSATKRLENVKATLYRSDNESGEGEQFWNAIQYDQINPQSTDEFGMYGWDVPSGHYQVRFEKEGYEPIVTNWLPVPPPQLDVNVGMRKLTPATLKSAVASHKEILIEMDSYMDASTLNLNNFSILEYERPLDFTVELIDAEGEDQIIASKFKLIPSDSIQSQYVTLVIDKNVRTYSGISLSSDIIRELEVNIPVQNIDVPEILAIGYGSEASLQIKATPAKAVAGKPLKLSLSSDLIADVNSSEVVFDENGYAQLTVYGLLPGSDLLTYILEGLSVEKSTKIVVQRGTVTEVAPPVANIPTGWMVSPGQCIYLSSSTPNAIIYYTIDGSCPCDPASRILYDDSPIIINEDTELRAMSYVEGVGESEIVVFKYTIDKNDGINDFVDASDVVVNPTVASDFINVKAPGYGRISISLINMSGTVAYFHEFGNENVCVDIRDLTAGVYVMRIFNEKMQSLVRIIKY